MFDFEFFTNEIKEKFLSFLVSVESNVTKIKSLKQGLFSQKSTLCVISIWKLDPVDENCTNLFSHNKIKT